jgi:MinD-like ATPase involved in chromosome partitioning or flagellar assembly
LDLPTYTNIWRIEKRLYKLYDFRLPMPVPVGQIAVFTAIAVPYVVILKVAGLPFSHTLLWLYIIPPGALAWLVSRPVLEGKRLPELVISQVRYLCEPRTWCRMAPLAEKDHIVVVARVWRRAVPLPSAQPALVSQPSRAAPARAARTHPATSSRPVPAAPSVPARGLASPPAAPSVPALAAATPSAVASVPGRAAASPSAAPPVVPAVPATHAVPATATPARPVAPSRPAPPPRTRPAVTVAGGQNAEPYLPVVERALSRSPQQRLTPWRDPVVVVPGGHRPGRPDQLQRDRARARLPLAGNHRIVVLGCTVGAGQTVTALMAGELLASLRSDQVAVLDLNPGTGSLAERARAVPALTGPTPPGPSRLEVISREDAVASAGHDNAARIFELISARYPLTLADPGAAAVPQLLRAASQLVLVAPANQDAAKALAATREWLVSHGHSTLADGAITVVNGVSSHTMAHVEQAEALARGRCRAIVRVPWDDRLSNHAAQGSASGAPGLARPGQGPLSPAALRAYTALAGVLVASVATAPAPRARQRTRP